MPVSDEDDNKERFCDSLIMCIVTSLNEGLRNGGGIGDVLRKPSSTVWILCYKVKSQHLLTKKLPKCIQSFEAHSLQTDPQKNTSPLAARVLPHYGNSGCYCNHDSF